MHVHAAGVSQCVDAGVAPLLALLWMAGVRTAYSCEQARPGWAHLVFDEPAQLDAALWAITEVLDSARREHVLQRLPGRTRRYEQVEEGLVRHHQDAALLWKIAVSPNLEWGRRRYVATDGTRILNYELLDSYEQIWRPPIDRLDALLAYPE